DADHPSAPAVWEGCTPGAALHPVPHRPGATSAVTAVGRQAFRSGLPLRRLRAARWPESPGVRAVSPPARDASRHVGRERLAAAALASSAVVLRSAAAGSGARRGLTPTACRPVLVRPALAPVPAARRPPAASPFSRAAAAEAQEPPA